MNIIFCSQLIHNPTMVSSKNVVADSPSLLIKFIGRISTMGKRKMVIYIPLEYHQNILKQFKGKDLKVTLEEAL
jgi:hypothetical protein